MDKKHILELLERGGFKIVDNVVYGAPKDIIVFLKQNIKPDKIKVLSGYQGFEVTSDHNLPIETDLARRDFTMNSIAKNGKGEHIDPFGGLADINAKIIKLTNPKAFDEDPLRMLRAINFASRFGFKIEPETFKSIQRNANKIGEITKERILIEFDKIVNRGTPRIGAELLIDSGLYEGIFGIKFGGELEPFDYVTKNSEFFYWLTESFTDEPDKYYKLVMRGDLSTTKEISALAFLYNNLPENDKIKQRWLFNRIHSIDPSMFNSKFVYAHLNEVYADFKSGKYPIAIRDLQINGNDLINLGIKKVNIGITLNNVIGAIYDDTITNNKAEIITYIKKEMKTLNESVTENSGVVYFFDFDGTLFDSPLKEDGIPYWEKKTGNKYPHIGWWGRPESLDLRIFDIKPNQQIKKIYDEVSSNNNNKVVLLTNRVIKLSEPVKKILTKYNMLFDDYSFNSNEGTKGERIKQIMKTNYPDYNELVFFDDVSEHFDSVNAYLIDTDIDYHMYLVKDGKIEKKWA